METAQRKPLSTIGLTCCDTIGLIAIIVLYFLGNDEECGIPASSLLLIYIIIKASSIPIRILIGLLTACLKERGVCISLTLSLAITVGTLVYYVITMIYFFNSDNDCQDRAKLHWVGLLLIIIEGFIAFALIVFLIICLGL
mmetsp:Transcript_7182/g.6373  ORF Transcript_7182/g.6373 Transcript_7182/m.6373 type:complete len:141 (+) Transcript_7182:42-464(+)